jgi:hypothetical protein
MNYLTNFADYIYSFFKEEDNLLYQSYKYKPFFDYKVLDQIDFTNTPTSDIVIKLNNMKHLFLFDINCYVNLYYNVDNKNTLVKLKILLMHCLESKNDTTDIMIKYIRKYKGEKNILYTIEEDDIEYKELERRYNELIKDTEDDNKGDNNNNNNDGMTGVTIGNKKRIALLN